MARTRANTRAKTGATPGRKSGSHTRQSPRKARRAANEQNKAQNSAKPLLVARTTMRATRRANGGIGDAFGASPFALGLALMQVSARLAGICLTHPLALALCRSPADVYRAQARVGIDILEACRPLLSGHVMVARDASA